MLLNVLSAVAVSQYAAKLALPTALKVDGKALLALGLDGIGEQQAQLAAAAVLSRTVCPCEAAHIMSGLPIIEHSEKVTFINSKPPTHHTVGVTIMRNGFKQVGTSVPPLTVYINRPAECENQTFGDYFAHNEVRRVQIRSWPLPIHARIGWHGQKQSAKSNTATAIKRVQIWLGFRTYCC